MEKYQEAEKDYLKGIKYKEIAEKYNVSLHTVKSWKNRYWSKITPKRPKYKEPKSIPSNKLALHKEYEDFEKRTEGILNEKERRFVMYYAHSNNARQSALSAGYGEMYSKTTVHTHLLKKHSILKEIEHLKSAIRVKIMTNQEDIINYHERVMNTDISDMFYEDGKPKPLKEIDGRVIKSYVVNETYEEVTELDKEGNIKKEKIKTNKVINITPEDRQKSVEFLSKIIGIDPSFKNVVDKEDQKLVVEKLKLKLLINPKYQPNELELKILYTDDILELEKLAMGV